MTSSQSGPRETLANSDTTQLREEAEGNGYLFIRGLLPADVVLSVAEDMGRVMANAGWIEPDVSLATAKVNLDKRCVEPQPQFMQFSYAPLSCKSLPAYQDIT